MRRSAGESSIRCDSPATTRSRPPTASRAWKWHRAASLICCCWISCLPKRDGFEILREVRRLRPTLPVIVLTARGDEADRVRGLRDGADDYVVKPFSVKELLARVEAVLRRSAERPADVSVIHFSGGTIDLTAAKCGSRRTAGRSFQNARPSCSAIWRQTPHGPSPARNCWRTSGESRRKESRPARSTCTSPGCGRSCATILPSRRYC